MSIAKKTLNFLRESLPVLLLLILAAIIATNPRYPAAVFTGLKTYCACIVPTLFPFLFITAIISNLSFTPRISNALSPIMKNVFKTGGTVGYAFFISLISGCPVGAKVVSDLRLSRLISQTESERAATFCSNASPAYLIAGVGTMSFSSPAFGVALFLLHLTSVLFTGFIFSFYKRKDKPTKIQPAVFKKSDAVFYESAFSAVISVLTVGALITAFYLFTEILLTFKLLSFPTYLFSSVLGNDALGLGIATGLIECTLGIKTVSSVGISFLSMPLCLFLCGFGGLSAILQSIAFLKKAKIKTAPFLLSKVITAVIGFILGVIYSSIFY